MRLDNMLDHYNSLVTDGFDPCVAATLVAGFFISHKLEKISDSLEEIAGSLEDISSK